MRSLERIDEARVELVAALGELEPLIVQTAEAVGRGESLVEIVRRTRLRTRRRLTAALAEMTSALAANRVAAIRVVIDDEGLTISDAARLFGVPRQVLSRLYHRG